MAQPEIKSNRIDFMRGHPSTELLATAEMLAAANSVLADPYLPQDSYDQDRHPLHYGPDLGNISFRRDVGIWSARRYGLKEPIPPENINLTSGASNGLAKALELFTNPIGGYTRRAFIVTPVYFLACPVFQDFGFSNLMTSISMEENGTSLNFEDLISHLEDDKTAPPQPFVSLNDGMDPIKTVQGKHLYRYVLYCVPTYSNPTGTTLSLAARTRLVELARKYDILLISDDVYDFLGYNGETPIKRLVTIDKEMGVSDTDKGHTISNSSFSKLIGPGVRCGWIESVSPVLAAEMGKSGANHSGGAPCQFTSTLVQRLLEPDKPSASGTGKPVIDEVIEKISGAYKERVGVLLNAIEKYWPKGTQVQGGDGGYFVWISLPEGFNAREIAKASLERGVIVGGGDGFEVPVNSVTGKRNFRDWGAKYMRLSISYLSTDVMEHGIKNLGETIQSWKQSQG
ncbi:hypothetical protein H072_4006 [Dactylellina haptotyla CBS 200.50]|uniref:Aminotransferase class I/classII large domain-containing protein n=1 Tax=Dactylellina haptotyla (strain CBS 200.50) TaxID=1284197 RepID=S8BRE9_DACHA|nr:hypothetical protein H072_4006 [Dactylellina haptotyla CBS 200.50]